MLYPKIGIRPVIDGRWGGVRESLENQTVTMANNAALPGRQAGGVRRWLHHHRRRRGGRARS